MKKLTHSAFIAMMIMTLVMGSVFTVGNDGDMGNLSFGALTAVASNDPVLPAVPVLETPELAPAPTLEQPTLPGVSLQSPALPSVSLTAPELPSVSLPVLELPTAPTLITPVLPSVPTLQQPVLAPVPTCSSLGYAYQVAKFEWKGDAYKQESNHSQFSVSMTGSAHSAQWHSAAPIGAVIVKAATTHHVFQGGLSGTVSKSVIGSGKHDISNAVFCANKSSKPPVPEVPAPICHLSVTTTVVPVGGGPVTFTWTTNNAQSVSFNQNIGQVSLNDSKTITVSNSGTYVLTATSKDGKHVQCHKAITVAQSPDPIPDLCPFEPKAGRTIIDFSGTRIRSDQTAANSVTAVKPVNLAAGTYTVTLAGWDGYIGREHTTQPNESWKLALKNGATTIATSNASTDIADFVREAASVSEVNNALTVTQAITAVQGVHSVYPDSSSANSLNPICAALDVHEVVKPQPECTLVANNTTLPIGGGNVTLTWTTQNADTVTLTPDGSAVAKNGSKTVFASSSTSFVITVTNSEGTKQCPVSVTVPNTPDPLTCSDVTFTGTPSQVSRGGTATLAWNWNDRVTSGSIDNGIGAVSNNGSRAVTVNSNTTYNLTIKNQYSERVCPVTITTSTGGGGGGGGGTPSPRCDLDISKSKIRAGESVVLSWDTTNATEVVIKDNTGKTLVTTEGKLSREKRELYDGEITLRPTKDTTYTLNASRGSRDRDCKVTVDVEGSSVTVSETRTQPPLVAGISLTQVPYTGFEAGPMLTIIFYVLLAGWSLFVTYLFVIRRDSLAGVTLPGTVGHRAFTDVSVEAPASATTSPAATYVATEAAATIPANLPIGEGVVAPIVGYSAYVAHATEEEAEMGALENRAHAQKALLSSDAMRYLMHTEPTLEERAHKLDAVIRVAKVTFPTEDGWVVLNLPRMEALLGDMQPAEAESVAVDTTPTTGGSLAEAIVTGNVIAAFSMIQHRPMIALADAVADLDALYRARQGDVVTVSDLLVREAAQLSDAQIAAMIAALTSAIDGTYHNEAEAVKMAIMKAVSAMV
jgi:hypothetical protein